MAVSCTSARKNEAKSCETARCHGVTAGAAGAATSGCVIQFDEAERRFAAWMNAARTGDRGACNKLLHASIPYIRSVARRQGVPDDLLDDVVQETLIAVHRSRDSYDPDRPYTAWLKTIARRRAIDMIRSLDRTAFREIHEPYAFENHADTADNPEDEVDQAKRKTVLGVATASLPARQREAVEQLALRGKSLLDAAKSTGQTPNALAVNLHRALTTLRTRFAADADNPHRPRPASPAAA